MRLPSLATLWGLIRQVERLLLLEEKHGNSILGLQAQIDGLATRMDRLEAREEIVVAKAEGAARAAAMGSATIAISDISRRLGVVEERSRAVADPGGRRQLPNGT